MRTFIFACDKKEGTWSVDSGTIVVNADTVEEARQLIKNEMAEADDGLEYLDIDKAEVIIVDQEPKGIVHTEVVWYS